MVNVFARMDIIQVGSPINAFNVLKYVEHATDLAQAIAYLVIRKKITEFCPRTLVSAE